jgi:F-type H+-transporting ATPase subunit delta
MTTKTRAQIAQLDEVLDRVREGWETPGELFAVVDLLDRQPGLRRALTDPGSSEERRAGLVHSVFDGRLQSATVEVLAAAAAMRWPGGRALSDAIERQGVRGQLQLAAQAGHLDDVEDELFRFSRTVAGDPALRNAVADRTAAVSRRQDLVDGLLAGRASDQTVALARRAVAAREQSFARTVESYVALAAQIRDRVVATVRVARPLDPEQTERLQRSLSAQVGRDIAIQVIVEPELLGGVRIELGGEVIDGTVVAKLTGANRLFT